MTTRDTPETEPIAPATSPAPDVRITECPDGPLLVRGATAWPDARGVSRPVTRPVVAVCRCTLSERLPWCDGSHKLAQSG